jgi:hypothetical protein
MTPVLIKEHVTGLRSTEDRKFSPAGLPREYYILDNPVLFTGKRAIRGL